MWLNPVLVVNQTSFSVAQIQAGRQSRTPWAVQVAADSNTHADIRNGTINRTVCWYIAR